ncbi:hypothetical protein [Sphingopyxis sp.]|uniref:hypothetical protein n=1 Tax=Sphingopyxis sp. TaxID=1908224 RepID=UPI003D12DAEE
MGALKGIMAVAGIVAMMMGTLFLLQGLGIVRWPSDSFMVGDRNWVLYGAMIALAGGVLVSFANRKPDR